MIQIISQRFLISNHFYIIVFLDAVHLANQHYKACVRRGNGKEVICYIPCTSLAGEDSGANTAVTAQVSLDTSDTMIQN